MTHTASLKRHMSHRHCGTLRRFGTLAVLPPLMFGVVHSLALLALLMLGTTAVMWAATGRQSGRVHLPRGRAALALLLDAFVWMAATGLLLGSLTSPRTVGPSLATLAVALAWLAAALLHRAVHRRS